MVLPVALTYVLSVYIYKKFLRSKWKKVLIFTKIYDLLKNIIEQFVN